MSVQRKPQGRAVRAEKTLEIENAKFLRQEQVLPQVPRDQMIRPPFSGSSFVCRQPGSTVCTTCCITVELCTWQKLDLCSSLVGHIRNVEMRSNGPVLELHLRDRTMTQPTLARLLELQELHLSG